MVDVQFSYHKNAGAKWAWCVQYSYAETGGDRGAQS
jgi:hypothetical protein